jgi:KTSC domain
MTRGPDPTIYHRPHLNRYHLDADTQPEDPLPHYDSRKYMTDMHPVNSSNIHSIGYAADTLHIKFKTGVTYTYHDVPKHIYDGLRQADSKMKYLNANIKGKFDHRRTG